MNDEATTGDDRHEDGSGEDALGLAYGRWVRRRRDELGLTVQDAADRLNRATGWGWEPNAWTQVEGRSKRFPEASVFRAMVAALDADEADALRAVGLLPDDAEAGQGGAA